MVRRRIQSDNSDMTVRGGVVHGGAVRGVTVREITAHVWPMVQRYCRARIGKNHNDWSRADAAAKQACVSMVADLVQRPAGDVRTAYVYRFTARAVDDMQAGGIVDPADDFARALHSLGTDEREVAILRLIEGLSVHGTGAVLGMTDAKVRMAQHRAVRSLRTAAVATDCFPGSRSRC